MDPLAELVGESPAMEVVRDQVRRLLTPRETGRRLPSILIHGETGTGKGLVARTIHRAGPRADGPFVDVNCAAIPETLLEAELFGFERGAFTDARRAKAGLFQAAHRGTIFLDEIGLLPEPLQAKLLKVLEEQAVRRLGATTAYPVDTWIVSATNTDLQAAVRQHAFREDLYHRLAVLTLWLPPLRERGRDILILAERFLARVSADYGLPPKRFTPDAEERLLGYPWPGNIRELGNVIERVTLLIDGDVVSADMLDLTTDAVARPAEATASAGHGVGSLDEAMREHLLASLTETSWNISRTAAHLQVSRNTVRARIEKFGLRNSFRPDSHRRLADRRTAPARPPAMPGFGVVSAPLRWERRHIALLRVSLHFRDDDQLLSDTSRGFDLLADKVHNFGGRVEELSQTSLCASFGLEPVEDAPRRAAHAAMAMQKAAERTRHGGASGFLVSIGLHVAQLPIGRSGAWAEIEADAKRTQWTVLDAILDCARDDEIVLSAETVSFLERRFEISPAPRSSASGRQVFRLGAHERRGLGLWGRIGPLVGRTREIELLRSRLSSAVGGHGQLVTVVGHPGVGKSRLVWELTRGQRAPQYLLLEAQSLSYGKNTSYLPVTDLMRHYFQVDGREDPQGILDRITARLGALDESLIPVAPAFMALVDVLVDDPRWQVLDPAQRRQQTQHAVKLLLLRESRLRPVVLVVEDTHWLDSESHALLDSLTDALADARILLIVTHRPEYNHAWDRHSFHTQVRVDPLSPESAAELLGALVGRGPDLEAVSPILIDWTGGNPLFLEETVRVLVETRVLEGERGCYRLVQPVSSIQVPATIEQVLSARIDRLEPSERRLLECAAAIGLTASLALLQAVTELPDDALQRALSHLEASELLGETGGTNEAEYGFRHALTHDVAYGSLGETERRRLHARILAASERLYPERLGEQAERLAHHALAGEIWEKAADYLREAGARAFARGAVSETLERYEEALAVTERLPRTAENVRRAIDVRLDLHVPLIVLGQVSRLIQLHEESERAARELDDPPRLSRLLYRMGQYAWMDGRFKDGLTHAGQSLQIATDIGDEDVRILATYALGLNHSTLGAYRTAAGFFRQVVTSPAAERAKRLLAMTVPAYMAACAWLSFCFAKIGELDDADRYSSLALEFADQSDHPQQQAIAYTMRATTLIYRGQLVEAVSLCERALHLCETKALLVWLPGAAATLGWALVASGRPAEGLPHLERAVGIFEAVGLKSHLSQVCGWCAEALLGLGRVDEARATAVRAVDLARGCGEEGYEAEARYVLARGMMATNSTEMESAVIVLAEIAAKSQELEMRPLFGRTLLALAEAESRRSNVAQAVVHAGAAAMLFTKLGMPHEKERA